LVPVLSGTTGVSPSTGAAALMVPSPPSSTITFAPADRMRSAVSRVSSAVPVRASRATNSSSGQTRSGSAWRRWKARSTPAEIPKLSVETSTRPIPRTPAAATSRRTMLVFSALGKTEARATSRRMSRPDIGLAMIPIAASAAPGQPCADRPPEADRPVRAG
jgi:hypothetical protein